MNDETYDVIELFSCDHETQVNQFFSEEITALFSNNDNDNKMSLFPLIHISFIKQHSKWWKSQVGALPFDS